MRETVQIIRKCIYFPVVLILKKCECYETIRQNFSNTFTQNLFIIEEFIYKAQKRSIC